VQSLVQLSDGLAGLVDAVGASVVRVEARSHIPSSGIVWSGAGIIVTASHTVELDEHVRVGLADGQTESATLVGRDPTTDIAVLRVDAAGLRTADWDDGAAARAGQLVVSLGRPGRTIRASLGMLGAVADAWQAPSGGRLDRYLQIDDVAPRGFSGGPLVTAGGRVLGMNTSRLLRGATLAVPAQTLQRVVDALVAHGRIRRGYLGIGAHPVRLPAAARQQLGRDAGLLVVSVASSSPAERAGLYLGDVIVGANGAGIRSLRDLAGVLTEDRIGSPLALRILRAGGAHDVPVLVGEREDRS
jgi:S1-C subfamily serine protease